MLTAIFSYGTFQWESGYKMIRKMTDLNAVLWRAYLKKGMCVLDATLGNGYDALMIKSCIGTEGILYGFDIQSNAIEASTERLKGFENVKLYMASHETIDQVIEPGILDAAIYNLGFLPGGDKSVTTLWASSLNSIQKAIALLKVGGLISVSFYPGHTEGKIEAEKIATYIENLEAKQFHVLSNRYSNQSESAPFTVWVEKKN